MIIIAIIIGCVLGAIVGMNAPIISYTYSGNKSLCSWPVILDNGLFKINSKHYSVTKNKEFN